MGDSQPRRLEERIAHEVLVALLLLGIALVQTTLFPRPFGFPPHLLLLLVVCHALIAGPASAARWAFYGGLGLDICAGSTLGTHALGLLGAVLCASLPLARMSRESWLLPLLGVLVGASVYYSIIALLTALSAFLADPATIQAYMFTVFVPGLITVLIPALPIYLILRGYTQRQRGEVPVDVY